MVTDAGRVVRPVAFLNKAEVEAGATSTREAQLAGVPDATACALGRQTLGEDLTQQWEQARGEERRACRVELEGGEVIGAGVAEVDQGDG